MIKHFCDICGSEMQKRIKVHLEAQETSGDGYFKTVGDKLGCVDYECCADCYDELTDILSSIEISNEDECKKRDSLFSKLKSLIKRNSYEG